MALLEIKGLTTEFKTDQGIVKAVRSVDYHIEKGEVLGIVGESGSENHRECFRLWDF